MDALNYRLPRFGLGARGDTWLEVITLAGRLVQVEAFGDQKPEPAVGVDAVIGGIPLGDQALGRGTDPGHRRQSNTVLQADPPDRRGVEQGSIRFLTLNGHLAPFFRPWCSAGKTHQAVTMFPAVSSRRMPSESCH